jgi:Dimerisation domain
MRSDDPALQELGTWVCPASEVLQPIKHARAPEHVIDLIFGRWRSQILYAGAVLGGFDQLDEDHATSAAALASAVGADPMPLYRLLRALASIGLLAEDDRRGFCLTEAGALLREDHPHSLKAMALHEEGPVRMHGAAIWPEMDASTVGHVCAALVVHEAAWQRVSRPGHSNPAFTTEP